MGFLSTFGENGQITVEDGYDITWKEPGRQTAAVVLGWVFAGVFVGVIVGSLGVGEFVCQLCGFLAGLLCTIAGMFFSVRKQLARMSSQNATEADELNKALQSIRELNEDLQQRVEQRTSELASANARLEDALEKLKESQEKEVLTASQAAVGALAAGMAHEMNNPLHAAAVAVQGLQEEAGNHPEWVPFLAIMDRSMKRCRRIIGEILSFSRDSKPARADVTEIVRSAVDTFTHENPPDIKVHLSLTPDVPKVLLDAAQIRQALLNLLANAMEAMQGKGVIQVAVDSRGSSIAIAVTDSGVGMTEEVRRRIFDPFFTTKQKGMGMGLSITWQLVQRNRGTMEVESREGAGSTFRIHLPLSGEVA